MKLIEYTIFFMAGTHRNWTL